MSMKYVREFNCDLTGERVVIVKTEQGVEKAIPYKEYISKHYSEAEHDEAQLRREQGI
jgi:hypothetical protein